LEAIVTESIRCCSCARVNDPWRRFCGECGEILQPGCRCGFANGRHDRYCGGCGDSLRISYANLTAQSSQQVFTEDLETKASIRGPVLREDNVSTQQIEMLCDVVAVDPNT
jgi:hypothetical protein